MSREVTWPHVSRLHDDVCPGQACLLVEQDSKLQWAGEFKHKDVRTAVYWEQIGLVFSVGHGRLQGAEKSGNFFSV
jgi:hypothetical protein